MVLAGVNSFAHDNSLCKLRLCLKDGTVYIAIVCANDVIITHHPADTNNDHMHTSMACQAAIRLFQRRAEVKPLKEFWFMEVLSSTEWSVNTSMNRFQPNTYVEVGESNVDVKIAALAAYRGAQSGCNYAEAFECVLRRI